MRLIRAVFLLLIVSPCLAQNATDDVVGREVDLEQLVDAIKTIHPNPFANIEEADWMSAVSEVRSELATMTRDRFGVALQGLVALLGDAHTAVNPQLDPALSTSRYPIEIYLFEDGLHVRSAAPEYARLVGRKVVRIGNASSGQAVTAVAQTISNENTWWIRAMAPERLVIPEVLAGLGIASDPQRLELLVEKDGMPFDTVIAPAPIHQVERRGHGTALDKTGWIDMNTSGAEPLWLRRRHDLMWHEWLEESSTLYVCYRAVTSQHGGPSNAEFWDEVFAEVDRRNPQRFVLDIRENSGGNGMLNRHVIQQVVRRPDLDRGDRFFVIIGRRTFSAGQQLANQLDWWTNATFVGEPTGQKVSQYGDAEHVVLERSGISVFISTLFHQGPNPLDRRDFIPPDVYAPLTAADYRTGVDPAMQAIIEHADRQPVMARVIGALQAGQFEVVERLLVNANMDPANRYRNFEADVNAIGYDLLGQGKADAAIAVFEINTRVHSGSANTFDSLGEALLQTGRRAEAIQAYRKALEIDPGFPSSLRALEHLENDRRE